MINFEEKIDIVIQGKYDDYTDEIIDHYLKLPFLEKIIVSCWVDNKEPKYFNEKVIFIQNQYPESPGTDNRNLQIVSSLNGLKQCSSKFSIKTRSDQKFTHESMIKMYEFFFSNNQRKMSYKYDFNKPNNIIMVAGIFQYLLFCPRDHIFWGNTSDLIDLFDIPLEKYGLIDIIRVPKQKLWHYYDYFIRTETYIGSQYIRNFENQVDRMLLLPHEHLYDNAIYWYYSKTISDQVTNNVFMSFPKECIDFSWPVKGDFNMDAYLSSANCWT